MYYLVVQFVLAGEGFVPLLRLVLLAPQLHLLLQGLHLNRYTYRYIDIDIDIVTDIDIGIEKDIDIVTDIDIDIDIEKNIDIDIDIDIHRYRYRYRKTIDIYNKRGGSIRSKVCRTN